MPFSTVFWLHCVRKCNYPFFPKVHFTSTQHAAKNPVTMTIINPRKEYCPSRGLNQKAPVFKSCALLTEPLGAQQLTRAHAYANLEM